MPSQPPWHTVKQSTLHGTGVFAARDIPAGTRILEYCGARITPEEADARHPVNPDDPFHTFYFSLSCGKVIDGGKRGNDARWINHSCAPNCEAQEGPSGKRVYIHALEDIPAGAELFYDYGLVMDGRITKTLREQYRCLCGAENCRGTMLALPKKHSASAGKGQKKSKDAGKEADTKPSPKQGKTRAKKA
ncbi:SET domain-containing protein [Parapusillimonas sp. SGNA-6]|nr:SET domain-containing protein [Parapusillimonas sp. SGNA-6]